MWFECEGVWFEGVFGQSRSISMYLTYSEWPVDLVSPVGGISGSLEGVQGMGVMSLPVMSYDVITQLTSQQ